MNKRKKISKIMLMHYWKLVYRSLLFFSALSIYIYNRIHHTDSSFSGFDENPFVLGIIWIIFVVEMLLRFLPSSWESMGCQKQFKKNYHSTDISTDKANRTPDIRTLTVLAAWLALNGFIGILFYTHRIDQGILLLISLAYSVCDMICILFFCPFQTWFLKNRCCTTCRIYNWDFAMMFTPLIFVNTLYAKTLVFLSMALLIRWEYLIYRYPERFAENTNHSLSCIECQEKLCHHKSQLKTFWKSQKSCHN